MVIDCFTFYNELELLEIRIAELRDVVDWFVLVEAGETYSGKPKRFVFDENRDRFSSVRICHIKIPSLPIGQNSWQREAYSRNAISPALQSLQLAPDDVVLLSDIDEIPRAASVLTGVEHLREGSGQCLVFSQTLYYYYVNGLTAEDWDGTRMIRYGDMPSLSDLRAMGGKRLPNAGWHFSYLGGVDRIREKIGAYPHVELDIPQFTEPTHVRECLASGEDLFGRQLHVEYREIDSTYPAYLLENRSRFAHLIRSGDEVEGSDNLLDPGSEPALNAMQPISASAEPCPKDSAMAEALYRRAVNTPSDISEHLPYLYRLASTVGHITEFGTRSGSSTSAFLAAQPNKLICYDLERQAIVSQLETAAGLSGVDFKFYQKDVLRSDIEETDLLFIDTWHVDSQMREELLKHAEKARLYLVMHDTETFGHRGETEGHPGIWKAIADYMRLNPCWRLLHHFENNNGLTIFTRL